MAGKIFTLALLVIGGLTSSWAASIDVDGKRLAVIQPEGYCWLDTAGSESDMAEQVVAVLRLTGQRLLAMFGRCDQLDQLRKGKATYMEQHGNMTVDVDPKGNAIKTRKNRQELITGVVASLSKVTNYVDQSSRLASDINKIITVTILELGTPKVISRDQTAVYVASMGKVRSTKGKNRTIVSISASTVVMGYVINWNLYDEASGDTYDYARLLARSQKLVSESIRLN